jgi:hypothetical protein
MKKYITYCVALFFAMTVTGFAAGADKDAIEAKEKAAWQAFKDKKGDDFKKLVDKDFRGVYSEGIVDLKAELDELQKADMKSFAISDFTAFSDEADVIVTTYKCVIQGTSGGHDTSGTYNCGTVWKKEGNDWLAIFHTNAKQEAAEKK